MGTNIETYEKKLNYPSLRKPGVYPPGTDKELGLDNDNLEKFSLGNWNSIVRNNRKFFSHESSEVVSELLGTMSEESLGRPVIFSLRTETPFFDREGKNNALMQWSIVRKPDGWDWNQPIDVVNHGRVKVNINFYPDDNVTVSAPYQFGPVILIDHLIDEWHTQLSSNGGNNNVENFYGQFGRTIDSDHSAYDGVTRYTVWTSEGEVVDHSSSYEVREWIRDKMQEKRAELESIFENNYGYIQEYNPNNIPDNWQDINDETKPYRFPIIIKYETEVQSQINEILDFWIEHPYKLGDDQYHHFQLYIYSTHSSNSAVSLDPLGVDISDGGSDYGPFHYGGSPKSHYDNHPGYNVRTYGTLKSTLPLLENQPDYVFSSGDWAMVENPPHSGIINGVRYYDFVTIREIINESAHRSALGLDETGAPNEPEIRDGFVLQLQGSSGEKWDQSDDSLNSQGIEFLDKLGYPNFTFIFPLSDDLQFDWANTPDFEIKCLTSTQQQGFDFLYYDINNYYYNMTSYPVKVYLSVGLFGEDSFMNASDDYDVTVVASSFYSQTLANELFANASDPDVTNAYYRYQVIQWGDEDILLKDKDLINTEFFDIYEQETYPPNNNYYNKRQILNQRVNSYPIITDGNLNLTSHVYNEPGVKSIKIIVYRYSKDGLVLNETILVTKNIVVNDGLLLSQDFSIFGGTDFNFLPLKKENQAIIGGLDEDSKYNNSVEKIVKDDNFIQDDYLERASSKDFIDNFNKGLYGEAPGQIDLSQTRVFTGSRDIYDFITDNKQSIVDNEFIIETLPIDSLATDIFISDDKCITDLNPANSEFLTIQNQVGLKAQGILIGDYKIKQPKNSKVQKEGGMKTPFFENDSDKQAF